ncbi:MAG TPA: VOC family protein [Mycobacteriales bacterium]|nr:VOC family protein [Mycobacteriales bacterium]
MGRVVHFEIHAGDPDRAERFYSEIFGWTITRWDGSPIDYRLITTGPDDEPGINGAILQRQGDLDGEGVIAYVCTVDVADIGQTEKAVAAAGGQQVMDRQHIPGVGWVAYFKDTEGNIFGGIQAEPASGTQ